MRTIVNIHTFNDGSAEIEGTEEQLKALGEMLLLKAKMKGNFDATLSGGKHAKVRVSIIEE